MESNWIEIKRFLRNHKKLIIIGAAIFSIFFAVVMSYLESRQAEETTEEEFLPSETEILGDAQPAYFRFFVEYEDAEPYVNHYIVNQYFNLPSVKEEASKAIGVDIEEIEGLIEEEITLNNLDEEINVILVTKHPNSHLFTVTLNSGNEQDNLAIANFYYNLVFNSNSEFFRNKKTYLFEEPTIAEKPDNEFSTGSIELENLSDEAPTITGLLDLLRNVLIGLILGIVLMIGLALLKVLSNKTLHYSFSYNVEEYEKFMLYDASLNNADEVLQFIAVPYTENKMIISEQGLNEVSRNLLTKDNYVSFNQESNTEVLLIEKESLTNIEVGTPISEIIIVVYPGETTRKWYKLQNKLSVLFEVPTKVIQING